MSRRHPSPKLDSHQAEMALRLWSTKQFDTFDIAKFVDAGEDAVCRTIQAARDIVRSEAFAAAR